MGTRVLKREQVVDLVTAAKREGKVVGFTSGTFDLLHPGHAEYLELARAHCDILVVGVNSDVSVRSYKSPDRPVCGEAVRAELVAALRSVDAVFVFDETNNNRNIELLQPSLYIKAGDYTKEKLSSARIVESYGGRVEIIPFKEGYSTTSLIESIRRGPIQSEIRIPPRAPAPAVFVDRDGTIIEHVEYLHEPEKLRVLPGAMAGLRKMQELGYRIILVTNQPGIGLGYFTKEDLFAVNRALLTEATKAGVQVDKIYFCPHSKAEGCRCRKPDTLFLERAREELNIDIARSFVIGDMSSDIEFGKRGGCGTVLVSSGRGGKDGLFDSQADFNAPNLSVAADLIEMNPRASSTFSTGSSVAEGEQGPPPELLEAIGRVCGKIGHDFNNLLGSIMGGIDLIQGRMKKLFPDENPLERQIGIIRTAVDRGVELTSKIRGYARPGPIAAQEERISACIEAALSLLTKGHPELRDSVLVDLRNDPVSRVDTFLVSQMLVGLLSNALEAMRHQSERTVVLLVDEVAVSDGQVESLSAGRYGLVSIVDHGKGLSDEKRATLFAGVASSGGGVGHGLGLGVVMAQQIVKKHGGALTISSRQDVGTTVSLYFPFTDS